ncbi:MAG TPA: hypothetical protein VEF04_15330 [Blastocatellia bacterium]|nr:hypothetical protein [Blastocatellia bacterium]
MASATKTDVDQPVELTDEEVTELNTQEAASNQYEAEGIGLPDLPGKSDFRTEEMPVLGQDTADSSTEAVMKNLRVGAGSPESDQEEQE